MLSALYLWAIRFFFDIKQKNKLYHHWPNFMADQKKEFRFLVGSRPGKPKGGRGGIYDGCQLEGLPSPVPGERYKKGLRPFSPPSRARKEKVTRGRPSSRIASR